MQKHLAIALAIFSITSIANCCKKGSSDEVEKKYEFTYKGCFIDREDEPDLEKYLGASRTMNRRECTERCAPEKTAYIGLQSGDACFCGNNYGKYGRTDDSYCMTPCKGSWQEHCGGKQYNAIYTLGKLIK